MPLAFESISHGAIAFGFFNIDSDMLLMDRYFFFSTEFCRYIEAIAECGPDESLMMSWPVYHISNPADVGDLMGAIHGVHFSGFIGEVYQKYPFPQKEADFKQKPRGRGHGRLLRPSWGNTEHPLRRPSPWMKLRMRWQSVFTVHPGPHFRR